MAYGTLRIPPSGPPLTNSNGGKATPGDGFGLRMVEAAVSANNGTLTDTFADLIRSDTSNPFELVFTGPNPNLQYRAGMLFEVSSLGAGADQVETRFTVDYDGGGFNPLGPINPQAIPDAVTIDAYNYIPLTLGSALLAAVPAGTQTMTVRLQARTVTAARAELLAAQVHAYLQECT